MHTSLQVNIRQTRRSSHGTGYDAFYLADYHLFFGNDEWRGALLKMKELRELTAFYFVPHQKAVFRLTIRSSVGLL